MLIAVALVGNGLSPSSVVASNAPIVLQAIDSYVLIGDLEMVNAAPGDKDIAYLDGNLTTYASRLSEFSPWEIWYYDFSNNTPQLIPSNGGGLPTDISGGRIAITEWYPEERAVIFDTATKTRIVVPSLYLSWPAIGANLVAAQDRLALPYNQSEISVYDLSTGMLARLTNDVLFDWNPRVSPDGKVVVWQKCQPDGSECDVYSSIRTGPGTFQTQLLTGTGYYRSPVTNGQVVVYSSDKDNPGDLDIYVQPVAGGPETRLAIPGSQHNHRISGNLIAFDSDFPSPFFGSDIFVYDLSTASLYRVTNSPYDTEWVGGISVSDEFGRIVFHTGTTAIWSFSFEVPRPPATKVNDLIAVVRSFNLPGGLESRLITQLQNARAAIEASNIPAACASLSEFISECQAQSGKKLTTAQANQLIGSASEIKAVLGCP